VDDPVNRVDVLGVFSLFGFDFGGESSDRPATDTGSNDNKPIFCNWAKCDENGTLQGEYIPIGVHPGAEPFLTDPSVPIPRFISDYFGGGGKEVRIPLVPDIIGGGFRRYFENQKSKAKE